MTNTKTHIFFFSSLCMLISCTPAVKRKILSNHSGIVICNYSTNDDDCISVGFYNLKTTAVQSGNNVLYSQIDAIPLAVLSTDGGQNFTQTSVPTLPNDADPTKLAELSNVSCIGQHCVGVGFYNTVFELIFNSMTGNEVSVNIYGTPFVTMSDNGGKNFSRSFKPPLPDDADPRKLAIITGINCLSTNCAAVGTYNFSFISGLTTSNVFAIVSNNGGESFVQSPLVLPSDADPASAIQLHGISCFGITCVGVGNYGELGIGGSFPLAVYSNNLGRTFAYASQPPTPFDIDTSTQDKGAQLNAVRCSGQNCVAVGYYFPLLPSGTDSLPFTVFSSDGGKSFQTFFIPALPSGADLSDNKNQNTQLLDVSCNGQRCVAVGVYYQLNINGSLPLAIVSTDGGRTFQNTSQPDLPSDADPTTQNAQLNGITCTDLHCVAVGFYFQPSMGPGGGARPLNVVSNDGGVTFQIASQPALPANSTSSDDAELGFNI